MNRVGTLDRAMQAQIDRLVGGDLPENERGNLLAWLDEDAGRWRACALAFLEAQNWEDAAVAPSEPKLASDIQSQSLTPSPRSNHRDGSRISILALTAALAVAFVSGLVLARWLPTSSGRPAHQVAQDPEPPDLGSLAQAPSPDQPLIATVPVRTNLNSQMPLMLQLPVSPHVAEASDVESSSVSEYERQQWERRGFEVIEEPRYLHARLPDGRPVVVPVNKVRLKFKGTPVS